MAFKMSGFKAHDISPLDNYKTGYFGEGKSAALRKTYAEAYKTRDMKTYGNLTQAEYTKEAKRQSAHFKQHGKWDAPSSQMKGSLNQKPKGTVVTTKRPGGGKKEVYTKGNYQNVEKYRKDGTIKKSKTDRDITNPDSTKWKEKYDKKGDIRKEKVISKQTPGEVRVDKTKYDKEGKVRKEVTRKRKKGGTGIGQAIKSTIARKKKKKEERKANKKVNKKKNSSDIFS